MPSMNGLMFSKYIEEASDETSKAKLTEALRLFLFSNFVDNTDLLDNNVPYDIQIKDGQVK